MEQFSLKTVALKHKIPNLNFIQSNLVYEHLPRYVRFSDDVDKTLKSTKHKTNVNVKPLNEVN